MTPTSNSPPLELGLVTRGLFLPQQRRRKHFRIGQAIKKFLLAPLANFLSTITTCKASLWLADASWVLKLMVASFQFLKPLLVKPLLRSILLDFSVDTHTAKYNVIWVVGLVMQPEPRGKTGRLARPLHYRSTICVLITRVTLVVLSTVKMAFSTTLRTKKDNLPGRDVSASIHF